MFDNLTPDLIVKSLPDLDFAVLERQGLQGVLLDLDNTLCAWQEEEIAPGCGEWVAQALARGLKLCIVSNSIRPQRLNRVAAKLGIPAVGRWLVGRKPGKGAILEALGQLGIEPTRAAMVGDQVLADVLGGNRLGMFTVWVLPLHKREFFMTKLARCVEAVLVRKFVRLGKMP